jgi:murein DD-endopeptidase MepM/ murein hydrolase activator NlpD
MGHRRRSLLIRAVVTLTLITGVIMAACGGEGEQEPAGTAGSDRPTLASTSTATQTSAAATPTSSDGKAWTPGVSRDGPLPTPTPTATPTPTPTPPPAAIEPVGFPLDPATILGEVTGPVGSREIIWGAGPPALEYSRDDQPAGDPVVANRSGWNCRLHVEYEGHPAVDWYIPEGTPIYATMDGTATLYGITTSNAFDYYGVSREPYIGDPDRANAPISPFPGPGGGKGMFVRIENDQFATEYGHLAIAPTLSAVPAGAYVDGYGPDSDYASLFGVMRGYLDWTPIATWTVAAGDLIGYSGDSGYSEAPHLHYVIERVGSGSLCATNEAGFDDAGWLFRGR